MNDRVVFLLHPSLRARAYLQTAMRAGLGPDLAVRLGSDADDAADPAWSAPADGSFDPRESLVATLDRYGVGEVQVDDPDVNGARLVAVLRAIAPSLVVFTGGGILREATLAAAPRWLHVHPGRLPDRRGSTCIHFGLLLDGRVEASAIFMRAGLDGGPVAYRRALEVDPTWTPEGLDHVDDARIRSRVLVETLCRLREPGFAAEEQDAGDQKTFYVIHPVLKHIALTTALPSAQDAAREETVS
ncbi:MAG TPA: hypothetical protein VKA86_09670 [Candidatus Krumholzibacteria bacterium]|nr:hypothetical protein [Candidatus Krumholzibacteria bacterium]